MTKKMNIISKIMTSVLMLIQFSIFGQNIGAWEINEKYVAPWVENEVRKYEGIYHFGEGDGSNLTLIINDSTITVQIRQNNYWKEGGYAVETSFAELSELEIKWEFKNLNEIKIVDGKFFSDQYQGEFVTYTDSTGKYYGLKILNPWNKWIGKEKYEIGLKKSENFEKWYEGKFPMTSYRKLTASDLSRISKDTLKIMRNEIIARYNYIFQAESEMDLYFQQQEWYRPRYKNVNTFLTDIELANIELIKKIEETK